MNDPKRLPIGLIGLGLLGGAMARRLIDRGFEVIGCDTLPERMAEARDMGVETVGSNLIVFERCERVILSLPNSEIVGQLADALLPGIPPGRLIVDTTTGDPAATIEVAGRFASAGIGYLDATVSGSSVQAAQGDVVVTAGGDAQVVGACEDIFQALARRSFHVGPVGSGARMKLVHNLVLGLNRAALAEGLALAERLDLDPSMTLDILRVSAAYSRAMDVKGRKMVERDFTLQARVSQHLKDVVLMLDAASEHDMQLPLSEVHRQLLTKLVDAGWGDEDNSAIIRAFVDERPSAM